MNYEIWENGAQALLTKTDGFTLCTLRRGGWRLVEVMPNATTGGDAHARFDVWMAELQPPAGADRMADHLRWWMEQKGKGVAPAECTCGEHPSPEMLAEMVLSLHQTPRQRGELQFTIAKARKGLGLKLSLPHFLRAATESTPENVENGERDAERKGTRGKT